MHASEDASVALRQKTVRLILIIPVYTHPRKRCEVNLEIKSRRTILGGFVSDCN